MQRKHTGKPRKEDLLVFKELQGRSDYLSALKGWYQWGDKVRTCWAQCPVRSCNTSTEEVEAEGSGVSLCHVVSLRPIWDTWDCLTKQKPFFPFYYFVSALWFHRIECICSMWSFLSPWNLLVSLTSDSGNCHPWFLQIVFLFLFWNWSDAHW